MRTVLTLSGLIAVLALSCAEKPKPSTEIVTNPEAPKPSTEIATKIFLVGNFRGNEEKEFQVGGQTIRTVPFQLAKDTPLVGNLSTSHIAWLRVEEDFKPVIEEATKAKDKYLQEREKAVLAEKDAQKQIELSFEYTVECTHPPAFVLVEGEIVGVAEREVKVVDKKYPVREVIIAGKPHVLDQKEIDRWRPSGSATVEGMAVPGEFIVGKETYVLAVKNGKLPIVLTGAVAKKNAKVTGPIRVTGELRAEKERLLLKAEEIEEIKR